MGMKRNVNIPLFLAEAYFKREGLGGDDEV